MIRCVCRPAAVAAPPPVARGRRAPDRGARGFTLLEMIVVVVLIGIVTTVLVAAMSGGFEGQRLRSAARDLAAQLRYTRTQALLSGRPQVFALDVDARTWSAPRDRRGVLPQGLQIDATTARDPVADAVGDDASADDTRGGERVVRVRFFADGSSTGGRIRLRPAGRAPGTGEWRVDVAWLTGQVSMARGTTRDRER